MTNALAASTHRLRAEAWVVLGVSVLVAAFELWTISPSFSPFTTSVIPDSPTAVVVTVLVTYGIWILAGVTDLVCLIALKGWRNRLIVGAGLFALVVPLVVTWRILNG